MDDISDYYKCFICKKIYNKLNIFIGHSNSTFFNRLVLKVYAKEKKESIRALRYIYHAKTITFNCKKN